MYNFKVDRILEMPKLLTTQQSTKAVQHNGSQHNATQRNGSEHNAIQQIQHNSDSTDRNTTQRNVTKQTQHNGSQQNAMQHDIMDYNATQQTQHNTTQLNTIKQEIKPTHIC